MSPLPQVLEQISFTGMRDSLDPTTAEPRKALLLENVYPSDSYLGAAVIGRPGCRLMGAQLGTAGFRRVQRVFQYTKSNSTEFTVAFVGGLMYTYDWGTETWTNVPLVGVSLSQTAIVYCVTFADVLVVSDGVNRPWTWDGTTFVDLTNAPVAFGQPVVYYGKLFFIKNSDLQTIVWSEELQPNTGYEAAPFNNAWDLRQTSQSPLYALFATNEALYYFRDRSMSTITGPVTPDFKARGTREGVSETVGTTCPNSITYYKNTIYWLSADGFPHCLPVGGEVRELWPDLRETLQVVPRALLNKAVSAAWTQGPLVLLGLVETATETEVGTVITIDPATKEIAGLWTGFIALTVDEVKNADGVPTIIHGSQNGYVYEHGNADGALWQDELHTDDGGTLAILHQVVGSPMGYSTAVEKEFDRWDGCFRTLTDFDATVDYETPDSLSIPQSISLTGAFALWDISEWDVDKWASINLELHKALGWNGQGRWIRPRIRHQSGAQRFGLVGWRVWHYPTAPYPAVR